MAMKIIIGTRDSKLALWQATWVKDRLIHLGHPAELKTIKTAGDKLANVPLTQSGTKGLFIKEIEEALASGSIHLAVHSMKDLPVEQPVGLRVAAVTEREDPRDVFISRTGEALMSLPAGSRVGTSSLRRQSQLRIIRRDLEVVPLRGNLDTRLKKLDRGECEALVLAAAGLVRLGFARRITSYFSVEQMCPAVGQGALALEVREGEEAVARAIEPLDYAPTYRAVRAERAALRHLGGGCQVPIAAHAFMQGGELRLVSVVANPDGTEVLRSAATGSPDDPESLGAAVARDLLERGARSILESIHV